MSRPLFVFTLMNPWGELCPWVTFYYAKQVRKGAVEWHGDTSWPKMKKQGYRVVKATLKAIPSEGRMQRE